MSEWIFEPGHTAVQFRVKHMMVSYVRGHIKDVHGEMTFDVESPQGLSMNAEMNLSHLSTGEPDRDKHLLSVDFLDAENHPRITFNSTDSEQLGADEYRVSGNLTIRGITKKVSFILHYQGMWTTPFYPEKGEPFSVRRIGFEGEVTINRHDFGVSWNSTMVGGGAVVGDYITLTLDIEALLKSDMR